MERNPLILISVCAFLLVGVLLVIFVLPQDELSSTQDINGNLKERNILPQSFNPEDSREIGYEFLDNNNVVHMWNTQDNYFFEKEDGIQLTNHYEDYWTRNIFCIGYYSGEEWIKIKCSDELTGFEKSIETDNSTYIEATLWKDFSYNDYDIRLGIQYDLGLNDENLSITIYGKNLGIDIPFDLGFAWKITDWEIPHEGIEGDSIFINDTDYNLDGTFDITFKNMTKINDEGLEYLPYFRGYDWKEFLRVDWDKNLNYAVKMFGNGNQEDFYVTLLINAGHFNPDQEKQTTFQWIDAEGDYTGVHWDTGSGRDDPMGITNNETHLFTIDSVDDEVYIYDLDGVYQTSWDTSVRSGDGRDITNNDTHIFILDSDDELVHFYTITGTYIDNWSTFTASGSAELGLTTNGTFIWETDNIDDLMYKYLMNGTYTGENWDTEPRGNGNTGGLTTNGTFIWAVDDYDSLVYKQEMDGTEVSTFDISGEMTSSSATGITNNNTFFWIVDFIDDEVYQYQLETPPDTTPPTFTTIPNNESLFYGSLWDGVTFIATDEEIFDTYNVNDSSFTINDTGFLNVTNLMSVGFYSLNITINDTSNNINWTIFTLEVNQSSEDVFTLFNETSPLTYPSSFQVFSNASSSFTIYRNGTIVSNNSVQSLGSSAYNFTTIRTDTENYSSFYAEEEFLIDKATPSLSLSGTTPINYGDTTDFSGSGCPAQLSCSLNVSNGIYSAGSILGNYSTIGNENYTGDSDTLTITINKIASSVSLTFDKASPQEMGTEITPTCSLVVGVGTPTLTKDASPITSGDPIVMADSGTFTFICSLSASENYTSSSENEDFQIGVRSCSAFDTAGKNLIGILTAMALMVVSAGFVFYKYKEDELEVSHIIISFMALIIGLAFLRGIFGNLAEVCV